MGISAVVRKVVDRVYPPKHMWFYGHRMIGNPATRDSLARRVASFLPAAHAMPLAQAEADAAKQRAAILDRDGWAQLPDLLSPGQVSELMTRIRATPCTDDNQPQLGSFLPDSPPAKARLGHYTKKDILSLPYLMEAANDPRVLATVSELLGCTPTISDMSMWWSFPQAEAKNAQFFHRDVDDLRFYKVFIHLTDVTTENGAHVFVKGSQRINKLTSIRRYQDSEVAEVFGEENLMTISGPAGRSFLENTYGFHKGSVPRSGRRLVFQAQYSVLPIALYDYTPVKAPRTFGRTLDPYINRLFVSG